ncbi:MAG: hypothetical protein DMF80_20480 [Acidobacteria bacterium]|nr:MAG: hypothetical protein DMF80_20480 [Acidobacteriota bacterium]
MSDYLWDGSGERDPEVERLERLLSSLRSHRPAPELPAPANQRAFGGTLPVVVAAAAVALAVAGTWLAARSPAPAWEVTRLAPSAGGDAVAGVERLRVGQWLETDAFSRARVKVGLIGEVEVEPLTRLRLVDAGARFHRLSLAHGTLHARIWAPPGGFLVDTPSALAVDLGCAYTLQVDESGSGLLRVGSGWVGFEYRGHESFVPEQARCRTRPGVGPGTPYYEDAPPELVRALSEVDFDPGPARPEALARVLGTARRRDALSLWHLLGRLGPLDRAAVYPRMAELVPPPAGVTREGVLAGDRSMLDRWWEALGLGSVDWWRRWKAPLPSELR